MKQKLLKVDASRGAPMGRPHVLPRNVFLTGKLYLEQLRWVDGDYDQGGAYWGKDQPDIHIYRAHGKLGEVYCEVFVREYNREEAKESVNKILPNVTFWR